MSLADQVYCPWLAYYQGVPYIIATDSPHEPSNHLSSNRISWQFLNTLMSQALQPIIQQTMHILTHFVFLTPSNLPSSPDAKIL